MKRQCYDDGHCWQGLMKTIVEGMPLWDYIFHDNYEFVTL